MAYEVTLNGESRHAAARAALAGNEAAFARLVERCRPELQVHCYRLLGSLEDSETLVQQALLRAWRHRDGCPAEDRFQAWLYEVATVECLGHLDHQPPARQVASVAYPSWLQPYPDQLLDQVPSSRDTFRETVSLGFMCALQQLAPRDRAAVVLSHVLRWEELETARLLAMTSTELSTVLRQTRDVLPNEATPSTSNEEFYVLQRFLAAVEDGDIPTLLDLAADNKQDVLRFWENALCDQADFRILATQVNRQPSAAVYRRGPDRSGFVAFGLDVLSIVDRRIHHVARFSASLFPALGLPVVL